jgi:hypothetical protein
VVEIYIKVVGPFKPDLSREPASAGGCNERHHPPVTFFPGRSR